MILLFHLKFPQFTAQPLEIEGARSEAITLTSQLLNWSPLRRPNASNALKHGYFKNAPGQTNSHLISSSRSQPAVSTSKFGRAAVTNSTANHFQSNNFQSNKVNEMVNSMSIGNNLVNSGEGKQYLQLSTY